MKVVAYSIKTAEKEPLAIANHKKHEITLISNSLSTETASFAQGKEAAIVFTEDDVSAEVIHKLADLGVKYIATRSNDVSHIDAVAAGIRNIRIANVPQMAISGLSSAEIPMALAVETINNLDKWQGKKCLGDACVCSKACDSVKVNTEHHEH
ncbi:MAG: lactate dehydrogenase [Pedobacter sp.]|nr:lactate dehydrogenase [Pedobacter sp.]